MKTMQDWLDAYGVSHQNPSNKLIHWFCVPLIFFTIIGLLSRIPIRQLGADYLAFKGYLHIGTLLLIFGLMFFLRLSKTMAFFMGLISLLVLWGVKEVNVHFPQQALFLYLMVFILAWVGQFIGHKIEGEKPSFFDDLKFLLIGPAWLMSFILNKMGVKY
jgi:uncharacterized membrane protein YGL010W